MNYLEKTNYSAIPDGELAAAVMAELERHKQQDAFVQGQYWEENKGCAVGCLLKNSDHAEYETAFGIPIMLAQLEDRLFEGLPVAQSKEWPLNFMGACMSAGNSRTERMKKLSTVGWKFLHWLLVDELPKSVVGEGEIFDNVRKAIAQCADVLLPLTKGEKVDENAAYAAYAASAAAYAAAYAAYAADAAADAARAAAYAADAAYAAYTRMADKLIEFIQEAICQ